MRRCRPARGADRRGAHRAGKVLPFDRQRGGGPGRAEEGAPPLPGGAGGARRTRRAQRGERACYLWLGATMLAEGRLAGGSGVPRPLRSGSATRRGTPRRALWTQAVPLPVCLFIDGRYTQCLSVDRAGPGAGADALPPGGGAVPPLPEGADALPGGLLRECSLCLQRCLCLATLYSVDAALPVLRAWLGRTLAAPGRDRVRHAAPGEPSADPRGAPVPCRGLPCSRKPWRTPPCYMERGLALAGELPLPLSRRASRWRRRLRDRRGPVLPPQPRRRLPPPHPSRAAGLPPGPAGFPR